MLNTGIIVGKVLEVSEAITMQNGDTLVRVTVDVPRAFRNVKGIFDSDEIECVLWKNLGEAVQAHGKVGSMIAIKGRIQVRKWENEERKINRVMEFIGEKVNFIPKVEY